VQAPATGNAQPAPVPRGMLDPRVSLARIDPARNRVTARIPVPSTGLGGVAAMAYGAGSVWLVDIALTGATVWVLNSVDETVSRIDPASDKVVAVMVGPRDSGVHRHAPASVAVLSA
jgi:DNA-binding beta-propeller fold protein YncE